MAFDGLMKHDGFMLRNNNKPQIEMVNGSRWIWYYLETLFLLFFQIFHWMEQQHKKKW